MTVKIKVTEKAILLLLLRPSWSHGSWIYNYLRNQCISPPTLWVWILLRLSVLDTTLCDKVSQWLATGRWFSPGALVSSTNKADSQKITEILLKVVLNTITLIPLLLFYYLFVCIKMCKWDHLNILFESF
jgi:hypothetical protein